MSERFLDRILAAKRQEVARLVRAKQDLEARAAVAPAPRAMAEALRRGPADEPLRIVAEVKFRSPSKGTLRPRGDPARIAERYEAAGAAAVSVLCDGPFFDGGWVDLEIVRAAVSLPVLCKEFVLDPVQVLAARAAGADAVLLIVRIVDDETLVRLAGSVRALGMTPLVEVASRADLDRALEVLSCDVVGVNSRDLETFSPDPRAWGELLPAIPGTCVAVAMSGVAAPTDLAALKSTRADAALVGEHLMRAEDPGEALARLLGMPAPPSER